MPALSTLVQPDPVPFEPNRLLRWIYTRFFLNMGVDERWSGVVRESAAKGIVVYVMRSISVLDFLCLDYLTKRFKLPLLRFVNDLGLWILEPFGRGERRISFRRQIPQPEALAKVIQEENSALLFLRRPPAFGEKQKGHALDVDLIRTLVEQQRKVPLPIFLVPQTFVWTRRPPNKKRTWIDLIFGPSEWPGLIRVFTQFFLNFRNAQLRSGEAFNVATFLESHQDMTDAEAADAIRYALLRRIERERRLVVGPASKTPGRLREELLRSPRVRKHLEQEARQKKKTIPQTETYAIKELRRLCAAPDPTAIVLMSRFLNWVWRQIYDGFIVDQEGVERVREAARKGPLVLLPSHKSHVDYLILSYVLDQNAISVPLIAAGDNLSFFPLGSVLRRCGAFFIRRSFRGKRLYSALVDAYLRKILVEGHHVEFFLEGGRSRTGKLLAPKLGLLSMVVNAGLKLPSLDFNFVPVSIGYERIVEAQAYTRELGGGEKEPESVKGLLSTSTVLRRRYGRLYIQFGEVLSFHDVLREAAALHGRQESIHSLKPAERRALVQRLAHRMTHEIDQVTMVTPTALVASALLSHREPRMTRDSLDQRCAELLAALQRFNARTADHLLDDLEQHMAPNEMHSAESLRAHLRADVIHEALELLKDSKFISENDEAEFVIDPAHRLSLEYHKNAILHFFVPSALIASALQSLGKGEASKEALHDEVRFLSRLFKYEFQFRADASFDDIFEDTIQGMQDAGELAITGDTLRLCGDALGPVYQTMLRTYFEAYELALAAIRDLTKRDSVKRKDWIKQTLGLGQRMFLAGEIQFRESISKPKLENTLKTLHDQGIIKLSGDNIHPGAALSDDESLGRFERHIAGYLPEH